MINMRADGALGVLIEMFDRRFDPNLPFPYMCSTALDRVHAEWTIGDCEISLEFSLPSLSAKLHAVSLLDKNKKPFECQLNMQKNKNWKKLNELLTGVIDFFEARS